MKNKDKKHKDYKSIFPRNPFVFNAETKTTEIKCPSCPEGFLKIVYDENGGDFVCACGFKLN